MSGKRGETTYSFNGHLKFKLNGEAQVWKIKYDFALTTGPGIAFTVTLNGHANFHGNIRGDRLPTIHQMRAIALKQAQIALGQLSGNVSHPIIAN